MNDTVKFDQSCERFRKFIIRLTINRVSYYALWGCDLSDNEIDKLLLTNSGKVVLFKNPTVLFEAIKDEKVLTFDSIRTRKWALNSLKLKKDILTKFIRDNYSFNVNDLEQYSKIKKRELIQQSKNKYNLYINIINLFGDYAYQKESRVLLKLLKNKNIHLFWEYCYDRTVWRINKEEFDKLEKLFLKKIDVTDFRKNVKKLKEQFILNVQT